MFLIDQEVNGGTHKGGRNSVPELNGETRPVTRNSIHPATTVTMNNINIEPETKGKAFMESYKESLTPASLSLYFYIGISSYKKC